jgi:hypothetical protein
MLALVMFVRFVCLLFKQERPLQVDVECCSVFML